MDLLVGIEFDLFVPSFPELEARFSLSPFWVEALLSINFLGCCLSLFFVGLLSDRWGRKPVILGGLLLFIAGSLLCLGTSSYPFLFWGRFLQGIGIASPAILSFLIVADTYSFKKQQKYMALLNVTMNTSVALAPLIGSYVALYVHWRGNFMVLLLLGIFVLLLTLIFVPHQPPSSHKEPFSFRAYGSLLGSKPLLLLVVHIIFHAIPYWVFVGISPLLYMEALKVPLSHFGYYQGVLAFVFALGCLFFSGRVEKVDQKKMLIVSTFIFIFSVGTLSLVSGVNSKNPLILTGAFLPFIVGQVMPSVILGPLCLNLNPEAKGRISALLQGGRLIFSALSLQIVGYFYQGSFRMVGFLLSGFISIAIITLFLVIRNKTLMSFQPKETNSFIAQG